MGEAAVTAPHRATFTEVARAKADELLGADLRALAALRMGLGALVLGDVLTRLPDLRALYCDEGVLPRRLAMGLLGQWDLSLYFAGGSAPFTAALFAVHALAALALSLGWRTRLSAVACWALTVSLQNRNVLVLQGADDLLRVVLFWSLFVPLGARWSLDARAAAKVEDAPPRRLLSPATAALLLQVALMYWFTYAHKFGPDWETGSSVYQALAHDHFGRPWAQRLLLPHPALLQFLARAVFAFELWGPTLLFFPLLVTPLRMLIVAGFWGLHLGMGATMDLAHFPFVSAVVMLPFLPSAVWDSIEPRLPALSKLPKSITGARAGWRPLLAPQLAVAVLFAAVFAWNVAGLENASFEFPTLGGKAIGALGLEQKWNMFAPGPARDSGWFVMPGTLADQSEVDLVPALAGFTEAPAVSWDKPAGRSGRYGGVRWQDYLARLDEREDQDLFAELGGYLCVEWNARHQGERALESVDLDYVDEPVGEPGEPRESTTRTLWQHSCI